MKLLATVLTMMLVGCASSKPSALKQAEEVVETAEEKDADDLTPRMMELANQQLNEAEKLWDQAKNAHDDKEHFRAESLTRQAVKMAKSAKALANNALDIGSDIKSWDKNPTEFEQVKRNAQMRSELDKRLQTLQQSMTKHQTISTMNKNAGTSLEKIVDSLPVAYFPTDSANMRDQFRQTAERLASYLSANQDVGVKLVGYADPRGGEEYNKELGQERAKAVKEILVNKGVESKRIQVASAGETGEEDKVDPATMQLYRKVEANLVTR